MRYSLWKDFVPSHNKIPVSLSPSFTPLPLYPPVRNANTGFFITHPLSYLRLIVCSMTLVNTRRASGREYSSATIDNANLITHLSTRFSEDKLVDHAESVKKKTNQRWSQNEIVKALSWSNFHIRISFVANLESMSGVQIFAKFTKSMCNPISAIIPSPQYKLVFAKLNIFSLLNYTQYIIYF